jgi:hypothetical protein
MPEDVAKSNIGKKVYVEKWNKLRHKARMK